MLQPWIKLRVGLHETPRVARMAKKLAGSPEFASWAGTGKNFDLPLRLLICGLLLRVWGIAREHGEFVGEDLVLAGLDLSDLGNLAGCPGFGEAMAEVNWAHKRPDPPAIVLPNFAEHNVAKTPAERMRLYRWRQTRGGSATLEQNSTEEKKKEAAGAASAGASKARPPAPPAAVEEVVMRFPCTVAKTGKYKGLGEWPLTRSKANEYAESFPNVNLEIELKKARQWLIDNNRKTYKGTPAYLSRWLGKAQNQARPAGGVYTPGGRRTSTQFLQDQARSLFDDHGQLHAGDPNDE